MTVKDAVAKRFEQFYDQRKIHPNKLATHAGAYSKIDLLFKQNIFLFYKMHLLRT